MGGIYNDQGVRINYFGDPYDWNATTGSSYYGYPTNIYHSAGCAKLSGIPSSWKGTISCPTVATSPNTIYTIYKPYIPDGVWYEITITHNGGTHTITDVQPMGYEKTATTTTSYICVNSSGTQVSDTYCTSPKPNDDGNEDTQECEIQPAQCGTGGAYTFPSPTASMDPRNPLLCTYGSAIPLPLGSNPPSILPSVQNGNFIGANSRLCRSSDGSQVTCSANITCSYYGSSGLSYCS